MKLSKMIKLFLITGVLILLMIPATVLADGQESLTGPGGTVTSAEELNKVLGGGHQVAGNTVTLTQDVALDKEVKVKAKAPLTLDLNEKSVVQTQRLNETRVFYLQSDFTVEGKGSVEATGEAVNAITLLKSRLTINDSTIKVFGGSAYGIEVLSADNDLSEITMNGGTVQSQKFAIVSNDGAIVNMSINDATIDGTMYLDAPYTYIDNVESASGDRNILVINGGSTGHLSGQMTDVTMKAGTVNGMRWDFRSNIEILGGTVSGEGIDVTNGRLVVNGGKVQSSGKSGLSLNNSQVQISGGTITTSKRGARGITSTGNTTLKIDGGVIKSTAAGSTSAGIYADTNAKVILQGTKDKQAYVKGYKYGIYKTGKASVSIAKSTKVFTPKGSKSSYKAGQKLPKSINGDICVKYIK